ncbi:unnamed protein product [Eruca vesicaria subsp. sativa]|uniref:Glabrous enhancer-binding protein-like DBD domain-containing protein n=1 Tax=Eruca vesicaria subsp. sativa TaxID=29727 RepID=A0ABC8ISR4_ERUVS|nr:unnamed protein product [Eruca vesicaria subsp. sativa]
MASNPKHPSSSSSSAGEKEMESEEEGHTIFSSEEDEPEDAPPRKRLREGMSPIEIEKNRLFTDKDEIVLLQGIIDCKGKNPFENKRTLYESLKGSFSFDVTLDQFKVKIQNLKRSYRNKVMRGGEASCLNPHQQKCFQLSKLIWGAHGIAFESANGKLNKSERRRVSKKLDLVSPPKAKGRNVQEGSRDMKKSPLVSDWDETAFFVGMDFLKEKWTKVSTETKKETHGKMKKLLANELECQKFEDMLKIMKDKCAQEKVELLNKVTSLIMASEIRSK